MKEKEFDDLIEAMSKCRRCMSLRKKSGRDCSLINIYCDVDFGKSIPSIWTDWYRRLDSSIMVIGQDWGPYADMEKLHDSYLINPTLENWDGLINSEKSLTKRMLMKYLLESAKNSHTSIDIDNIFITNAIMCARKGNLYRGENIDLLKSTIYCSDYLKRQIDIIKPRVIITLGYYPILSLATMYGFHISHRLSDIIRDMPVIKQDNFVIIPCYHPTAQVKKDVQFEQYMRIWDFLVL